VKARGAFAPLVAVVLVGSLPACTVQHRLTVTGSEVHRNLGALRANGSATVDMVEERDDSDDTRRRPEVLRADQPLLRAGQRLSIAALARGCRDVVPFADDRTSQADCPLVQMREVAFEVRTFQSVSFRTPIILTALFAAGAGGGFAFDGLRGSDSTLETAGNHAVGFLCGFLIAGTIWMIVDCKGRWGQPGCRD
jgi:hypothetical protein